MLKREMSADLKQQIIEFNKALADKLAAKTAAKSKAVRGLRGEYFANLQPLRAPSWISNVTPFQLG